MTERTTDDTPSTAPVDPESEPWVYAGEAARILGCTTQTVRRQSKLGRIPSYRPWDGANRRYRVRELEAMVGTAVDEPPLAANG